MKTDKVQRFDSPPLIAKRNHTTIVALAAANGFPDGHALNAALRIGMVLCIP